MYKDFSNRQTQEIKEFKSFADNNGSMLRDYHSRNKDLYDIQVLNFKHCLEVIKVNLLSYGDSGSILMS